VPLWIGAVLLIATLASRPIEVRLWRAGRISDRALTILLLARLPVVSLVAGVLAGGSLPIVGLIVCATALGPVLAYRHFLGIVREQHR
jgi:hypothetical protein